MDEMKKLFDDFVAEAEKLIEEKYKKKEEVRTKKIKHEIPGKTIYWGEEAPEEMDWYDAKEWCEEQGGRLPTRVELLQAYEDEIEGFSPDYHWSSSERNSNNVWYQNFDNGYQLSNNKNDSCRVRCVFDNNESNFMRELDNDEKKKITPTVEPDTDLQSYEEKGFTPEKEARYNSTTSWQEAGRLGIEKGEPILQIFIIDKKVKITLWGRIKTKLWNFILPPHIRLKINK